MATYSATVTSNIVSTTLDIEKYISDPILSESLVNSTSLSYTQIFNIIEDVINNSLLSSSANINYSAIDYIVLLESLVVNYEAILTDTLSVNSNLSNLLDKLVFISEQIIANSTLINKADYASIIVNLCTISDYLDKRIGEHIAESVLIDNTILIVYKAILHLIESFSLSDSLVSIIIVNKLLSSDINLDGTINSKSTLNNILSSPLIIKIGADPDDTYLSYLLSPETNSVSNYDNYNFNGCTKFGYKYLFYNKTGIYEYGGLTDNGDLIRSEIATVAFNFQTSNLKQIPSVYLGVDSTDKVILKVRVDGKAEVHYQLNKFTNNLMTQKIDIGKGLIGRYFQFELITEASEFNMESIEFYPLEIRRKL